MTTPVTGFAFPFEIDRATGRVKSLSDDDKLRANVIQIVLTNVGERVMRRRYGGGLRQLIQDPNDNALSAIAQHQIGKSIGLLEPRVLLQRLAIVPGDGATLIVSVRYVVRRTQAVQSLSVPINVNGL